MGKHVRFVLLGLEAVVTFTLSVFIVYAFFVRSRTGGPMGLLVSHFLPSLFHLIVTLVAAVLLCILYRANTGAEAQLLPMLFFVISLGNVKILPLYYQVTHLMALDPEWTVVIPRFSFLFSSFLFLGTGLSQQKPSTFKEGQYIGITATCSLFASVLAPLSTTRIFLHSEADISNKPFLAVCLLLNVLAVLTFLFLISRERGSRHTLTRCIALILMTVGNATISVSQTTGPDIVGLTVYAAGTVLLVLVTRTYHIWT